MFLTLNAANTLYQFWVHTRLIGKLGPAEWIFNTPSHHRVHHARNPQYIDKNHAGTLIIWDRLFGTFAEEREPCVYGITTPLRNWNPVWANFHYWVELFEKARRTGRLLDRIRLFTKPPGWHPEDLGPFAAAPEVDPATYRKYDSVTPWSVLLYVFLQFVVVNVVAVVFFFQSGSWPGLVRWGAALALVVTLASLGGLLDRKPWAFRLEAARLGTVTLAVLLAGSLTLALTSIPVAVLSLVWVVRNHALLRATESLPRAA